LVATEDKNQDEFTNQQISIFDNSSKKIIAQFNYPILRHVLNSSGIERFKEAQFDMVRMGIGLYGISAVNQSQLMNISTLKTSISQIKQIKANTTVGYNRKGVVSRNSTIATIPIGYADGLNRKLGNGKGKVKINGKYAPFIGNICMDMCMVDITDIDASEGDEVIIFDNEYTISDIAKTLETIPYEILTGISRRVKRVYYQE
jgi:alanine racemase